jgi:curved DNA-binding protein CbpA
LKTAKRLLKQSNRKNLYAELGVVNGSDATDEEIKKAYKKAGK